MNSRRMIIVTVALSLFCASWRVDAARGQVLFQDDLENQTAGTAPTTADLDPVNAQATAGWWVIGEAAPELMQVLNNSNPGDMSSPAGSNNYQSIAREGTSAGNTMMYWPNPENTLNQKVEIKFDIWRRMGDGTFGFTSWGSPMGAPHELDVMMGPDFHIKFDGNNPAQNTINPLDGRELATCTIPTDSWQTVVINADLAAQTWSVTTSTGTWSDGHWLDPNMHHLSWVKIGPLGNYQDTFFDNISVRIIPEPGMFSLIATGLLGLLAYAWRRRSVK